MMMILFVVILVMQLHLPKVVDIVENHMVAEDMAVMAVVVMAMEDTVEINGGQVATVVDMAEEEAMAVVDMTKAMITTVVVMVAVMTKDMITEKVEEDMDMIIMVAVKEIMATVVDMAMIKVMITKAD